MDLLLLAAGINQMSDTIAATVHTILVICTIFVFLSLVCVSIVKAIYDTKKIVPGGDTDDTDEEDNNIVREHTSEAAVILLARFNPEDVSDILGESLGLIKAIDEGYKAGCRRGTSETLEELMKLVPDNETAERYMRDALRNTVFEDWQEEMPSHNWKGRQKVGFEYGEEDGCLDARDLLKYRLKKAGINIELELYRLSAADHEFFDKCLNKDGKIDIRMLDQDNELDVLLNFYEKETLRYHRNIIEKNKPGVDL